MENEKELNFSDLDYERTLDDQKSYLFRDPVVERVVDQFVDRSDTGYEKYGQTLDSERRQGIKNLGDYLQDVQEELMDAILYIQAAKEDLVDKPQCPSKCNRPCQVKDVKRSTYYGCGYVSNHTHDKEIKNKYSA